LHCVPPERATLNLNLIHVSTANENYRKKLVQIYNTNKDMSIGKFLIRFIGVFPIRNEKFIRDSLMKT